MCIIGGGPVGLFTALQLKIKFPYARVLVVEQYTRYQRDHVVHLNDSFIWAECYLYQNMIDALNIDQHPIQQLEILLQHYCQIMGVEFCYQKITAESFLLADAFWNQAQVLIGADGAKSMIRQTFFSARLGHKEIISHVVKVKVPVTQARKMNILTTYKALKTIQHMISEQIQPHEQVWFVQVSPAEFEYFQNANLKHPLRLSQCSRQHPVIHDICQWSRIRHQQGYDAIELENMADQVELTGIELSLYAAEQPVKTRCTPNTTQLVYLVGDAAMGAPYFQALNTGLRLSNYLIKSLLKRQVIVYEQAFSELFEQTRQTTQSKTHLYQWAHWWVRLSSQVPWQLIKF